jgi:putative transposase
VGYTEDGERILLGVSLGMRESFEDWQTLGRDLISRGLGAPMLIVADGAAGLTQAIEQCWPASDRHRCCVHRARNLYATPRAGTNHRPVPPRNKRAVTDLGRARVSQAAAGAVSP